MRKPFLALLTGALVVVLSVGAGASVAGANGQGRGHADDRANVGHNLETPLSKEQAANRTKGLELQLQGKVKKGEKVAKLPNGRFVELAREDTDRIFVVLAEFGDEDHAAYPVIPEANAQLFDGPLHNQIPEPDRSTDNTTLWQPDFNTAHYENMYFNRMAEYYERQSSGRYSVEGDVIEWVKVPFNERRYGSNDCDADGDIDFSQPPDDIVCSNTWFLVRDAMAFWVQQQLDSGKTMAEINAYLSTFDVWDRYDINGNGNFDEPDGVIDHFQIVHSGGDEAAGDPLYGQDAIWSHRWATQLHTGCPYDVAGVRSLKIGRGGVSSGITIPTNETDYCVYDYTIQPENGGLGVFAHEFGHDLGLPDLYDTSGNTGGAENSTAFWTLMSSGANIGDGGPDGIGDAPTDLGAWEKLQLGWLGTNYDVALAGETSTHRLGPAEFNSKYAQALFVVLPEKEVSVDFGDPAEGPDFFYSGAGDDLDNTMTKQVTVGAGVFSAQARYEIETDWDYAYAEISTAHGKHE